MKNSRKFNDKIRNKVSEITSEEKAKRIRYFVDKRVRGRRKIFKSYGSSEWIAVWEKVLKEMDLEKQGWYLYEGRSDYLGSVYGIALQEKGTSL